MSQERAGEEGSWLPVACRPDRVHYAITHPQFFLPRKLNNLVCLLLSQTDSKPSRIIWPKRSRSWLAQACWLRCRGMLVLHWFRLLVDKAQDFLTFILTNQSFRSNRSLINGVLFTVNAGLGRLLNLEWCNYNRRWRRLSAKPGQTNWPEEAASLAVDWQNNRAKLIVGLPPSPVH